MSSLKSVTWTSTSPGEKTPTIRFENTEAFFSMIDQIPGDVLIVTDIPPPAFAELQREKEARRRKFRFRYDSASHNLIVTLGTALHERLHAELYSQVHYSLTDSGLSRRWTPIGHTTLPSLELAYSGGETAEADSSGGPFPERAGPDAWPTLVVQSGDTKTLAQLREDMHWWFARSDHQVKIVLLAKFDHRRRVIQLEKWEEELPLPRSGATTTRLASTPTPVLRQEITIRRNGRTKPASFDVTGGPLLLRIERLLLQDLLGPQQQDLEVSVSDLQHWADTVWCLVRD